MSDHAYFHNRVKMTSARPMQPFLLRAFVYSNSIFMADKLRVENESLEAGKCSNRQKLRKVGNKKATQIALRWLFWYCLTVLSIGLSIYARFSQSVTCIGLSATVSGQRRPVVSALPLGSKYWTFKSVLTGYAISIASQKWSSTPPQSI